MRKYKFLQRPGSLKDSGIKSEELQDLEKNINSEAEEGWKVISCIESNFLYKENEIHRLLVLLEKDE